MKQLKVFTFLSILAVIFSANACKENCNDIHIVACSDEVPNEMCQAYFQRYFYDSDKGKCELISYSGCSEKGFATLEECEECKCNN